MTRSDSAAGGDHAKFLACFLSAEADLKAFVGAVVRDRDARNDIVQQVAVTLWETFPRYDETRPFGAWARGVASRVIRAELRKGRRIPVAFEPEVITAIQEAFDRQESESSDREEALRECVEELPEPSRGIVRLRYEHGHSCHAVAEQSGKSVDAVYQVLSRIRERLADCVKGKTDLEGGKANG